LSNHFCVVDLEILISKQPSPSVKAKSQLGSIVLEISTIGLFTGTELGNNLLRLPDKLQFIDALIFKIFITLL
jgi:hypothetical protein